MHIILKLIDGRDKNLELEGVDTIAEVRKQVALVTGVHPEHQRLVLMEGDVELLDDTKTVAQHDIHREAEIRLLPRPPPRAVVVNVGGIAYTTMLSTLRQVDGSRLAQMFDGLGAHTPAAVPAAAEHQRGGAGGRAAEGVPLEVSTIYLLVEDGSHLINRNGAVFSYVLDYLRDLEWAAGGGGGADAPTELALPSSDEDLQRLAKEADFYGLPELAAACRAAGPKIKSLPSLASVCSVAVADILELSGDELTELFQQQGVNLVLAKRIRTEIERERERVRAQREAAQARAALQSGLRRMGADLSDAGLHRLAEIEYVLRQVCALDALGAQELGLSADDARRLDALGPAPGASEAALTFAHVIGTAPGRGTMTIGPTGLQDPMLAAAVSRWTISWSCPGTS
jgi:hypothetical protein